MRTLSAMSAIFALTLLGHCPLRAAEYHVAATQPAASDDNPGTAAKPWKTIAKAAATAQAGDTVLIHAGWYAESVTLKNAGAADKPITFRSFADDEVLLDGANTIAPQEWELAPNAKNMYACRLVFDNDPGQILVDGKAVYVKVDQISHEYPRTYKLGTLTDADKNFYQYDVKAKKLLLNLGGDSPAKHVIRIPVRGSAFQMNAHCVLAGIHAQLYVGTAIYAGAAHAVIEDCLLTDCGGGICVGGWDNHGVIVRRNTVIGSLSSGIFLQDRPTGCLIQDNLAIRCTLNPAHEDCWIGSIKMNSAADTVFAHNVVLEAGNPRHRLRPRRMGAVGRHQHRAHHVRRQHLRTTRRPACTSSTPWATRGRTSTRRIATGTESPAGSRSGACSCGTSCWKAAAAAWLSGAATHPTPPPTISSRITSCGTARRRSGLRSSSPTSRTTTRTGPRRIRPWPSARRPRAARRRSSRNSPTGPRPPATTRTARCRTPSRPNVGLDTVTFRVADAKDPTQVLMMVGNGGCEWEDPAGQNILPYFWRPGLGDGVEHKFPYAAYCGLEGGCQAPAYGGAGGTVCQVLDPKEATKEQPKLAHSGLRCLRIDGQKPADICKNGLGFWSPSLPARAGDTYDISFFVRGIGLKTDAITAVTAFVEFTDATGQHRHREECFFTPPYSGPTSGLVLSPARSTGPRPPAQSKCPDGAKRMRIFLGMLPATGKLLLDDISIKVK